MINEVLKSFITIFVVMDSIGNIPFFLEIVKGMPKNVVRKQLNMAITVAAVLMALFLFFGSQVLKLFSIDINSFRIAGGIILLIFGIHYVFGIHQKQRRENGYDISVPIGTPLLVSPGVITTIIILTQINGVIITLLASVLSILSALIILRFSARFYTLLGKHWTNVVSRVMGIMLASIAVEFIRVGITEIFK